MARQVMAKLSFAGGLKVSTPDAGFLARCMQEAGYTAEGPSPEGWRVVLDGHSVIAIADDKAAAEAVQAALRKANLQGSIHVEPNEETR